MAKITLSDIASELPSNKPYNTNNASIEAEFQNKVLYRDNPAGEPNAMQNDLDMNNNDILNINTITIGGVTIGAQDGPTLIAGVNSVSMTVPTGLSVTGSPILAGTDGTLAVSLTAGYTIPLDTDIANWNTAYSWGDHSVAGYLTSVTAANVNTEAATDGWVLTSDGLGNAAWEAIPAGITDVVSDTTPQLGGDLDVNGFDLVSTANADIDIIPNGTGNVKLGNLVFDADQVVGAGTDDYVLTYDNATGFISLEAAAGGGGGITQGTVNTTSYYIGDATAGALTGSNNIIYGYDTAGAITATQDAVILGAKALDTATTGNFSVVIGSEAMQTSTGSNQYNVAIGYRAMKSALTYTSCVSIGAFSCDAMSITPNNITALGHSALGGADTADNTTAIGSTALSGTGIKSKCTVVGAGAMTGNGNANRNTAVGYLSMSANTIGNNNTAVGNESLKTNTSGADNTALGYQAMFSDTGSGNRNTAIGKEALKGSGSGSFNDNIGIGYQTGLSLTTGSKNVFMGYKAGSQIGSASDNVFIGYNAAGNTGVNLSQCVGIGTNALLTSGNTSDNTAIGYNALTGVQGASNTAVGHSAGSTLTGIATNNNTLIGHNAQPSTAGVSNEFTFGDTAVKVYRFPGTTTVAGLPSASTVGAGARAFVTDATATTFASVVAGGGANGIPVYSDGTNWRIG